ncbi:hypothetical protein JAAARDRAFT_205945 [Jaapia argillacea MUCL 33604]|uniref:F-box domain-containing protein n=1 Tax=Jaapia argillacea MUCL 33604 TaxID=933084 RepID=A0A067Q651_9AGAM|nr:hypothetical protein JAAARDRAFT_205945 [Jaapia argillacea MUCL 33604]
MSLLDLSYDVLLHILLRLDDRSLSVIVLVCHQLYHLGMPRLMRHVSITSIRRLIQFCTFMDSELSSQWLPHIRSLTASFIPYLAEHQQHSRPWAARVAILVRTSLKLETFASDCIEELLSLEPTIGDALTECRWLARIYLLGAGNRAIETLSRMTSPICKVHLAAIQSLSGADIFSALTPFHSTLEYIHIADFTLLSSDSHPRARFPMVRNISMFFCTSSVDTLLKLFPEARSVWLYSCRMSSSASNWEIPCWGSLESLELHGTDLSDVILTCPIDNVILSPLDGLGLLTGQSDTIPFLKLIKAASPSNLEIRVTTAFIGELLAYDLGCLIPQRECLVLRIIDMDSQNADYIMACLETLITSFKSASTLFYFQFSLSGIPASPRLFPHKKLEARIQTLANILPTLLAVFLNDDESEEFWHIRRDAEGQAQMRHLPGKMCLANYSFWHQASTSFREYLSSLSVEPEGRDTDSPLNLTQPQESI